MVDTNNNFTMYAFGQNYHFTAAALASLKQFGMGAPATLTNLILQFSLLAGVQVGDHYEFDYEGVRLSLTITDGRVTVDLPPETTP